MNSNKSVPLPKDVKKIKNDLRIKKCDPREERDDIDLLS